MCYPKPGPRCSTHALKKLNAAKARLKNLDPADFERFEKAKHNLSVAQEEYLTTPAGIKRLLEKAEQTGDNKYAVKAAECTAKREEQMEALRRLRGLPSKGSQKLNPAPNGRGSKEDVTGLTLASLDSERIQLSKDYTALERLNVPETLYGTKIKSDYEYDHMQCGPDGYCNAPDGDYCRDSEYVNLRVDPSTIDTRRTLADIYGIHQSNIPDELERIGKEELHLDDPESYDTETEYGYYGAEGARITLSNPSKVRGRLKEYYNTEYAKLQERSEALAKKSLRVQAAERKAAGVSKSPVTKNTKTPSKTASTRKRGAKAAPKAASASGNTVTMRRQHTEAELDAFERDAMPEPGSRKATAPKAPVAVKPKRRERTTAELDAFERDERI